jgi:hypothetical protein
MIGRKQAMAATAVAFALLTVPQVVAAQTPAPGIPSPLPRGDEAVNLTMEQRHIIKEIIVKDMKSPGPGEDQVAKVPAQIGATVPSGIPVQPMPVEVSAKVPQLKSHSFLVKDDKVLIIDPKDNKVAALIE